MNEFYPKISVITPSYNQGNFLRQTIKSVLNQNYPNLEYIIIDGGSNDESISIIKEYSSRINYWVSENDNGQTDAINKGLKVATGEIVTWINSDDLLMPNSLMQIAAFYIKKSKPELISASCIRIDEHNNFLYAHFVPRQTKYLASKGIIYIDQPGTFWKKNFLDDIYLDTDLTALMDHDLWYKLTLNDCCSVSLNKVTAAFRLHCQSKTSTIMPQFIKEGGILRNKYCRNYKISIVNTMIYRIWKLFTGYYFKSFLQTKFPDKSTLLFLKSI